MFCVVVNYAQKILTWFNTVFWGLHLAFSIGQANFRIKLLTLSGIHGKHNLGAIGVLCDIYLR